MKKIFIFLIIFFLLIGNCIAEELNFNSKYIYAYNLSEDKIMFEQNSDEEIKVASLTKIMTAIIVIENNKDLDKLVTITNEDLKDMYEYTTVGFQKGDEVTIKELLYGILLKSGSDAVNAAVRVTTDTEEDFIRLMNQKVKELGLVHTYFSNPIGKDEGNYSSVSDIASIMKYCLKNKQFEKIISTPEYYIENLNINIQGPLYNSLSKYKVDTSLITGAKTGFTNLSKHSMVSFSKKDDLTYIVVTSFADSYKNLLEDTNKLYNYLFNNYVYKNYNINFDIDIENGKEEKYNINLDTKLYLDKNYDESLIKYKYDGINKINLLVKKGYKLGTVSVYYDKDLIKKIDIKLNKDIEYKPKVYFKIIITLLIIFISIFLIFKNKKIVLNKLKKINSRSSIIKNSEIEKINILEKTTDINLFFRTFKNFKCNNKEKERLEHDFIDRCFQSIDFKNKFELNKLNSNLFSHKSEMCLETIKYCKKLFKYCTDEYINVK